MIDHDAFEAKNRYLAELSARTDHNGYITDEQVAEAKRTAGLPDAPPPPADPGPGPSDGGARGEPARDRNLYREIHDAEQAGDWATSQRLKTELLHSPPVDPVENARQRIVSETTPNNQ